MEEKKKEEKLLGEVFRARRYDLSRGSMMNEAERLNGDANLRLTEAVK